MSLLSDTLFAGGSARLHGRGGQHGQKVIKKSKSYGGFLSPLVQLARNPAGTLGGAAGEYDVPESDAGAADANRRQILYLQMKDVGVSQIGGVPVTC
jgi:TAG lipase/steryl ester hydrolase/phospholipase A2/LPA acyltransferase